MSRSSKILTRFGQRLAQKDLDVPDARVLDVLAETIDEDDVVKGSEPRDVDEPLAKSDAR